MVAALFLIASSTAVRASDPVPVQTEPESAAISAAKQQLEEMKSASDDAGVRVDPKLTPSLPVTQLNPVNEYVVPTAKPKPDTLRRRRSENWLVDAVMQPDAKDRQADSRNPRGNRLGEPTAFGNATAATDDANDGTALDRDLLDADDPFATDNLATNLPLPATTRSSSTTPAADKVDRAADFNPLSQYLSDWLSSQDLSLLKNTADAPGAGALPGGGSNSSPALPGDLGRSDAPSGLDAFTEHTAGISARQDDNPFLQFLKTPDPVALPPPPADAPPPTVAPLPPTMAPDPGAKSAVPDFAKPSTDDKYFKPLKRF